MADSLLTVTPLQEPTLLELAAIATEPLHGYGIIQAVAELSAVLRSFAAGLRTDLNSVTAGLTLAWSAGPVDGTVNRIVLRR